MIVVRTLNTVGGERSNRRFTRRLNRTAREKGFPTWGALIAHMQANRAAFEAIQKIAAEIEQRKEAA